MTDKLSDFTGAALPKTVEVGGVKYNLGEFDMRTRALWLNVAEEYELAKHQHHIQSKVIPKISSISQEIQSDPRLKSLEKRMDLLQIKHDKLMETYATDDEPEDIEAQIEAVVERLDEVHDQILVMSGEVQQEIFAEAEVAQTAINEFMELQDRSRVDFLWRIAVAMERTELEFEEFYARCGGDDYEAAERFVAEGNARWASLYENRMQQKPKKMGKVLN